MTTRTYSELNQFQNFEDRFEYLSLRGVPGETTFGYERWLNQSFYRSHEWKRIRNYVIARDNGCDLGVPGFEIHDKIIVHHMNPMSAEHVINGDEAIIDMNYLISTTHRTHNAIHYGDARLLLTLPAARRPGDTKLW